jgi:hypothetical protein
LIERGIETTLLRVSVRANPPANVTWKINGREISRFDEHFTFQSDGSLQINRVRKCRTSKTIEKDGQLLENFVALSKIGKVKIFFRFCFSR